MIDIEIKHLSSTIRNVVMVCRDVEGFTLPSKDESGISIDFGLLDFAQRRILVSDLAGIIQELCE